MKPAICAVHPSLAVGLARGRHCRSSPAARVRREDGRRARPHIRRSATRRRPRHLPISRPQRNTPRRPGPTRRLRRTRRVQPIRKLRPIRKASRRGRARLHRHLRLRRRPVQRPAPGNGLPLGDDARATWATWRWRPERPRLPATTAAGTRTPIRRRSADFHSTLDPYGSWTEDPTYGSVWVPSPSVVGTDFTPYVSSGHWAYDSDYAWVSDYDWGWAPFHYGRWVYAQGPGWEWIPGRAYAGAWVSWRYGYADWAYVGWAPLAPTWCWRGGVAVGLGYVPRAPYAFVGSGELFSPSIRGRVMAGAQVGVIAAHTRPFVPTSAMAGGARTHRGAPRGRRSFACRASHRARRGDSREPDQPGPRAGTSLRAPHHGGGSRCAHSAGRRVEPAGGVGCGAGGVVARARGRAGVPVERGAFLRGALVRGAFLCRSFERSAFVCCTGVRRLVGLALRRSLRGRLRRERLGGPADEGARIRRQPTPVLRRRCAASLLGAVVVVPRGLPARHVPVRGAFEFQVVGSFAGVSIGAERSVVSRRRVGERLPRRRRRLSRGRRRRRARWPSLIRSALADGVFARLFDS